MSEQKNTVIYVVGMVDGTATAFDGQFVVDYDPGRQGFEPGTGRPMFCHLVTTAEPERATRYTTAEAFELWRAVDPGNPTRADGKPNRPLSAFTVSIVKVSR